MIVFKRTRHPLCAFSRGLRFLAGHQMSDGDGVEALTVGNDGFSAIAVLNGVDSMNCLVVVRSLERPAARSGHFRRI